MWPMSRKKKPMFDVPTRAHAPGSLTDPEPAPAPEGSPYDRPAGYWRLSGAQRVAPSEDSLRVGSEECDCKYNLYNT
jgi:hypothetical protein